MTEDEPIQSEAPPASMPIHFAWVLLLSLVVFHSGMVITETVEWTDHLGGLLNGLVMSVIFSFLWAVTALPWAAVVYMLHRDKGRPRARTAWALAPSVAMGVLGIVGLVMDPSTPYARFEQLGHARLPEKAEHLRWYFSGGGFADVMDGYSFTCTAEETDRLIREMKLTKNELNPLKESEFRRLAVKGVEDFKPWPGVEHYSSGGDERTLWFYDLVTDKSHTRVFVRIMCI